MFTMDKDEFIAYMDNLKKHSDIYNGTRSTHEKYIMILNALQNKNHKMWEDIPTYND